MKASGKTGNAHGASQAKAPDLDQCRRQVRLLPLTLRPAVNQQLEQWETLFPFEQNRLVSFVNGIGTFNPQAWETLTAPLRVLEAKMGVRDGNFSESEDTIGNASLLARSEYYAEWRREVERVYEAIQAAANDPTPGREEPTRAIILILPGMLPVDPQTAWRQWDPRGRALKISGNRPEFSELLGRGGPKMPELAVSLAKGRGFDSSDLWFIDAGAGFGELLPCSSPAAPSVLEYAALKPFRDVFLAELNKAPKNIRITDEVMSQLRHKSWEGSWPPALAGQPRLQRFIVDLFLSGNGALIFSNAFAEWAASEALRRARPRALVVRFGMRSKPKPFASIAVFENQRRVSSLPDVDDPENSAMDALILARYVWLAACRYPEGEHTLCVCISEYANSAYVTPPAVNRQDVNLERSATAEELYNWIATQLALGQTAID